MSKGDASLLEQMEWPGNVRELKNFIERAAILSNGSRLRVDLAHAGEDRARPAGPIPDIEAEGFVTDAEFRDLEKRNITAALDAANWRVSGANGAAELLGVKASTLSYRIKTLGIKK